MKNKFKNFMRKDSTADLLASLMAIVIGLIGGLIILIITNKTMALKGFASILVGGFSDMKSLGQVLYFASPIIMTGLSVGFANKTGLFNIGASGQFIIGAYAAIYIGVKWPLPGGLHWIVALIGAMIAGGIWGSLPGILKATRNVNEVISCIMMNYIGMYLVNFMIKHTIHDVRTNQTKRVLKTANLPKMGMDKIFRAGGSSSSANSGILIAILFGILMYIVLTKTKFGYELTAVGLNRDAAQYAGINETKSIIRSMVIAGALAGLGGALLYLSGSGKGIDVVDVMAQEGFNGIPVALLGLNNPIAIIFSGLFIAHLDIGGFNMQVFDFEPQIIEIIIAIIIYFSAFALLMKFVINYFRNRSSSNDKKSKKEAEK